MLRAVLQILKIFNGTVQMTHSQYSCTYRKNSFLYPTHNSPVCLFIRTLLRRDSRKKTTFLSTSSLFPSPKNKKRGLQFGSGYPKIGMQGTEDSTQQMMCLANLVDMDHFGFNWMET